VGSFENKQSSDPLFTRLTNAFSKKVENHARAVALFALYYRPSTSVSWYFDLEGKEDRTDINVLYCFHPNN